MLVPYAGPPYFRQVPTLAPALELSGRTYWPLHGRLKRARLARAVSVGALVLPEGTSIEANSDAYVDPRRPDRLKRAILETDAALPIRWLLRAQPGTELVFDDALRLRFVKHASASPLAFGRAWIDGSEPLSFDDRGELSGFTLGAPLVASATVLPRGSSFGRWLGIGDAAPDWYVKPSTTLALAQFPAHAVHAVIVAHDFSRVLSVRVLHEVTIDGHTIRGRYLPIPLDASLRVELAPCGRAHLLLGR